MKPTADAQRNIELAKIHIAKAQLGMADDEYRALLKTLGGVNSAADLSWEGRQKVLDHFKRCGFRGKAKPIRPKVSEGQLEKIRGLWADLDAAGALRNDSPEALNAYSKRMTRIDQIEWITSAQAAQLIEALKKWKSRIAGDKHE